VAAKIAEEWNQSNENRNTKQEDNQHIKARLGRVLKEKTGKQCNACVYRQLIGGENTFL